MNNKIKFIAVAAALAAVIAGAAVGYSELSDRYGAGNETQTAAAGTAKPERTAEPEEQEAPDFTMLDGSGAEVTLSAFRGKPVVLNFWATWCGPCKSELPAFDEAYAEYGDRIQFVMLNLAEPGGENKTEVEQFAAENGYGFPIYYDSYGMGSGYYGVRSIPASVFIDAQGMVKAAYMGAMSAEQLNECIGLLL